MTHEPIQPQEAASNYKALPCPFCGKNPVVAAAGYATIYCVSDDCFGPKTTAEYLVDALVQWNTRASVPAAETAPGYKLVPLLPTKEMIDAGTENNPTLWMEATPDGFAADVANDVYVSMVRAAPETPSPAGNAEQPRLTDNDAGEITVTLAGRELRGWSYKDDAERRAKMFAAREYVEGWCDGRDT